MKFLFRTEVSTSLVKTRKTFPCTNSTREKHQQTSFSEAILTWSSRFRGLKMTQVSWAVVGTTLFLCGGFSQTPRIRKTRTATIKEYFLFGSTNSRTATAIVSLSTDLKQTFCLSYTLQSLINQLGKSSKERQRNPTKQHATKKALFSANYSYLSSENFWSLRPLSRTSHLRCYSSKTTSKKFAKCRLTPDRFRRCV